MKLPTVVAGCLTGLLALGCASSPTDATSAPSADIERERIAEWRRDGEAAKQAMDANRTLLDMDKAMDKYAEAIARAGSPRVDNVATGLRQYLRDAAVKNFDEFVRLAVQGEDAPNRARAVAALGFSGRSEALDPLLSALKSGDATIVANAAFALGVLRDPRTPAAAVGAVVEDAAQTPRVRSGAAWALLQIQESNHHAEEAIPTWLRILADPKSDVDAWVQVQALRGLARTRDRAHVATVTPFLEHPTPLVREAAALALGYLGDAAAHAALLERLGPEETNPNVRLGVRKALQALAGNIDRGYDVKEWRRVFTADPIGR